MSAQVDTKDVLAEQAFREVMACIGCHDCMLACPLPEASIVTIAELNDAVMRPSVESPSVIQFVSACTQCRQCVPACPADLSRADMVLFNKMKVEDQIPDQPVFMQRGSEVALSPFTLDGLAQQLTEVELFTGVAVNDLRRLSLKVTLRELQPSEVLCQEGTYHERLYVVLSGSLQQISTLPGGMVLPILLLAQGAFFGELAVMADQPEPFTVVANERSVVLEIPKAAVKRLMQQAPSFAATMDELYRRRALWSYLHRPGVLEGLPDQAMQRLMEHAELDTLQADDVLVEEGKPPGDVFVVRTGFLRASVGEAPHRIALSYFREGDLLGVLPLLHGEPVARFTVTASCRSDVIRIPAGIWAQVMREHPNAQRQLAESGLGTEHAVRQTAASLTPQAWAQSAQASGGKSTVFGALSLNEMVEAGVAQGSEVLVVDQTRCVHCRGCIDACARRHGQSRLELQGLQLEQFLFPTACRHCEDPKCLLCSVHGIVRLPSGEITIVDDNCIGCGACADRCPYGNIRMHPRDVKKPTFVEGLWSMVLGVFGMPEPPPDPHAPQRAVKCDLCAGYDDYACVTACPVGAAFRVDPTELVGEGNIGLRAREENQGAAAPAGAGVTPPSQRYGG